MRIVRKSQPSERGVYDKLKMLEQACLTLFNSRPGRGRAGGRGRGVGKGGRKLGVRGGLVDKNNLLAAGPRTAIGRDARKARKADWQKWVEIYTRETENMIKKTKRDFIKCPECKENISKNGFLNHRTRNCQERDDKMLMSSWDLQNYV